ncbi:carboxylating nicotinate-nucleotide diphosphorylase [Kushneria phosphatilytica]|uniref:nicotinate-nucleotide diphosphorylase (carboxylating) n=1 Tax=Kushneria phosphatilytica TaxID=657387 RepID=A0A1S1P139_9GAMM|nr:carboxylating nicotinate-nucleotide diphosphorylase [Kushneria phosphatilytica]OHV13447.1 nicotinate-nucleotide diphosphorylase (carboxylating) [Kushneria phosphatilytica]QEL10532.1 carboxylating nicotinate-nucleotide diphosphorylase [Kushneria phosphatilytica]
MKFQEALAEDIRISAARLITEDIGPGDITSQLIPGHRQADAYIIAHETTILCGVPWVEELFRRLDPTIRLEWAHFDGNRVATDTPFLTLHGAARSLLAGREAALNVLRTLSATATRTRHCVDLLADSGIEVVATRQTLPGLRLAQKYAVKCGGGFSHRTGLHDAFLIESAHIAACGDIARAVAEARDIAGDLTVGVAIDRPEDLEAAAASQADFVRLESFTPAQIAQAVRRNASRVRLEAMTSSDETALRELADTGIDRLVLHDLTCDVRAINMSMPITLADVPG